MFIHSRKIFSIILVISLLYGEIQQLDLSNNSTEKRPHITGIKGTFIQPWLYMTYDENQWEAEMKVLKEIGIEYLVMGDVANHNTDGTWTVYYNSELDFLQGYTVYDALEPLFFYCNKFNIKLYLGMGLDCAWDSDIGKEEGREKNRIYMQQCNSITTEIFNKYKKRFPNIYYGFYFVTELFNTIYMETNEGIDKYADGLEEMFTMVIDNCNKLDPKMPLMFSPYVNIFGYFFTSINIDRFTEYWAEVLKRIPFRDGDMICPQDSCGGGGNDIAHLEEWTLAYRNAVDRANKKRGTKLLLGTNAEMFVSPDSERMSSPHGISYVGIKNVRDFTTRLEIANKYVDSLFCFAYPHNYSPYNNIPAFHQNFLKYLKTGEIESKPPTPPTKVKAEIVTAEEKLHLQLTFEGMTDDTSVAQTNIYKNGKMYDYVVPGVKVGGDKKSNTVQNIWIDWDFDVDKDSAVYEFECIDVCGNISGKRSINLKSSELDKSSKIEKATKDPINWEKTALDYFTYQVTDGGVRIKNGDKSLVKLVIPDTIEGVAVTVIDWYAFERCDKLKEITLPDTVTHISRCAFAHCISLEKINMPSKLYSIELYAFYDCPKLTGISFPKNLNQIEERAFYGCHSLSEITIPKSCNTVGKYAFFNCNSLNKITVEGSKTIFEELSMGYLYDNKYKKKTIFLIDAKEGTAVEYAKENEISLENKTNNWFNYP